MSRTVVRHRYVLVRAAGPAPSRNSHPTHRARAQLKRALRYLEARPLGAGEQPSDRALFDGRDDSLTRSNACATLAMCATNHLAYHRLILSPGLGADALTRDELLLWTRRVMADLEARFGRDLVWVAAVHHHTGHPHIHILVGASSARAGGQREQMRLTRADYAALRESGDRWSARARDDEALVRAVERHLAIAAGMIVSGAIRVSSGGRAEAARDDEDEEERRREARRR